MLATLSIMNYYVFNCFNGGSKVNDIIGALEFRMIIRVIVAVRQISHTRWEVFRPHFRRADPIVLDLFVM